MIPEVGALVGAGGPKSKVTESQREEKAALKVACAWCSLIPKRWERWCVPVAISRFSS